MLPIPRTPVGFVLIVVCSVADSTVKSADAETATAPLEFQILSEADAFETDQGAWLTAVITNQGTQPITLVWGDYAYDDVFVFELTHPDGTQTPAPRCRRCPPVEALTSRDVITLAPGERRERTIVLTMLPAANSQPFRFFSPGAYLLRSRFRLIQVEPSAETQAPFRAAGEMMEVDADDVELALRGPVPDPTLNFSMKGVVENADGEPVSGVEVFVESQQPSYGGFDPTGVTWHRIDRVVTDARGRFAVEGLDRSVPAHRLLLSHLEHPLELREIHTIINEGIVELDPITLRDGYPLPGIITDTDGNPMAGVRITTTIDREFWTNLDGRFHATGSPTPIEELDSAPSMQVWKRGWVEAGPAEIVELDGARCFRQTLMPESAQQITGIARFENGEPAANRVLHVYRTPSDGYPLETTMDHTGRFTLDWPQSAERANHGRVAILDPGESHLPRRAWVTDFDEIAPGESNVEFVLSRGEQLEVEVMPAGTLPESVTMTVNVRLKMLGHREQWLFEEHLPSTGGSLNWNQLSPGEYSLEVSIDRAKHWNWTQTVVVPADDGKVAACRFELPVLEFGSATLNVVTSDGVTPWLSGNLWMDSSRGWGSVPVRNGRAELLDVPAGPIHVEVHTEDYARTHLHGEIIAGETVDLGTLQALTIAEGTGLVVGRVLLPGGGPAIGARVQGRGGSYARPLHLGGDAVDGDGLFEIRLDPGEQTLEINDVHVAALTDADLAGDDIGFSLSQRRLATRVDVVAGGESEVEITLPQMESEIQVEGKPFGTALLFVPIDERTTFEDVLSPNPNSESFTWSSIPEGFAHIALSRPFTDESWSGDASAPLFAWEHHWVDVSDEPAVLELATVQAGRVRVMLATTAGDSVESFLLRAAPMYASLPAEVQSRLSPDQVHATGVYVEDGNGVLYLAPGRYELTITEHGRKQSHAVEVQHGETVDLTLVRMDN